MRIDILSVLPELLHSPLQHSIMKRAQEKGLLEVHLHDLREFGLGKHKQLDDYQFGGGAGMVMMAEPIANAIENLQAQRAYDEIIFMTPDGHRLDQPLANRLSLKGNLMILCGHYKGIDERIREHFITLEISIGDYVLSGGELPAAVLVDAIGRLLPGVLNDETSALFDSFQDNLLAPPVFTRPADFRGWQVPDVLLSGNFSLIEEWRLEQSLHRTRERRPDLLEDSDEGERGRGGEGGDFV
ncbi:MAG: tRNA (guanosine(37)-N1)-methyltransferase TrmD [Saprospiraceae bacterium]|nr:tRNA (guanosine(37)-N1)-methyltransferase TrmD [Saprospiraceae bacterium]